MIDESRVKDLNSSSQQSQTSGKPPTFQWAHMPQETLLRYKLEIEACLPPTRLKDVDVESELVAQLRIAQSLQARVIDLDGDEVPLNQIVQAVNSVSSVIERLARLQIDLVDAENLKKMEAAFIKAVEGLPNDVVEAFFERYDRVARETGVQQ